MGPPTGSGLESGLRPRNAGGPGDPDRDLDRLRLHGAESGNGSRKVVPCKWGLRMSPSKEDRDQMGGPSPEATQAPGVLTYTSLMLRGCGCPV